MSASKNNNALNSDAADLNRVRAEIDKLDRVILNAVEERATLASQVSHAKSGRHIFRPGREADLIRNLARSSDLPAKLIEQVWRSIIAHNLTSQAELKIAHCDDSPTAAAARFRFGTNYEIYHCRSEEDVIAAVASGDAHLGILPDWQIEGGWLECLREHSVAGKKAYIAAYTHMLADHGLQQSVILSSVLPDASANDMTLVMDHDGLKQIEGHHPDAAGIIGIIQICDIS